MRTRTRRRGARSLFSHFTHPALRAVVLVVLVMCPEQLCTCLPPVSQQGPQEHQNPKYNPTPTDHLTATDALMMRYSIL